MLRPALAFLIISELPFFKGYYSRNWPLFGPESGFLTLGLAMLMLGNGVLGNLNKEATSQKSLGLAFWRIVIGAGIVVFFMGAINIVAVSQVHRPYFQDRNLLPT